MLFSQTEGKAKDAGSPIGVGDDRRGKGQDKTSGSLIEVIGAPALEENMPNFMLAYYGGNEPGSQEEGMAQMEKWKAWVKGLGESIVNPGTPLPVSKIVTSSRVEDDTDSNAMKGFAVVHADSMAAAVEIAQSDPFLDNGGTIRVSQMMEMNE